MARWLARGTILLLCLAAAVHRCFASRYTKASARRTKLGVQRLDLGNDVLTPCYELDGEQLCLPYLYMVGLPKAGSSALWYKLKDHHQVHTGLKEDCPVGWQTTVRGHAQLVHYFNTTHAFDWARRFLGQYGTYTPDDARAGKVLLSTCMAFSMEQTLHGRTWFDFMRSELNFITPKVFVSVRDHPDYLYSIYNWADCSGLLDDTGCEPGGNVNRHPRTKEHFHELVMRHSKDWHTAKQPAVQEMIDTVGVENVLVIGQHELLEAPARVLQRIEQFAGLQPGNYAPELLHSVLNARGAFGAGTMSDKVGEADMLPETYAELADRWHDECVWFHVRFNLCFPSCCNDGQVFTKRRA